MNYLEKIKKINKFTQLIFENKFVQWLTKSLSYLPLIWRFFFTITIEIFLITVGEELNKLLKSYIPKEEKFLHQIVDIFIGTGSWIIVGIAIIFTILVFTLNILEIIYNRKISTKQILNLNQFIDAYQYSKFATPLDIDLYGRESDTKNIIDKLNHNNFLMVSGKSGVGKTRIVIEVLKQNEKESDYSSICIFNRGADLYEDINSFFNSSKKYIVFIDDVNRIHLALDYLIQLYPEKIADGTIKIIMTVRDYAKSKIIDILNDRVYSYSEVILDNLDKEEIKNIVKNDFNIVNLSYIERIQYLSKGNPRLAVMISKIASEKNDLRAINDVSAIYDSYYKKLEDDFKIFTDKNLMKVVAIISFYRIIDKTNEIQMSQIKEIFGFDIDYFWQKVQKLNDNEIVDLYEDEVVKISEQILSTYLFYKIVFVENIIGIEIFISNFILNQNQKLNDVINPILNSFDFEFIIDKLKLPFDKLKKEYDNDFYKKYELIKKFWYVDRTENLIFLKDLIDTLSEQDIERINKEKYSNDKILELIKVFSNDYENYKLVLEFLFKYYEKNPTKIEKIMEVLKVEFGFKRYSHKYNYQIQTFIVNFVIKNIDKKKYIDLFLLLAEYYLQTVFDSNESDDKYQVTFYRFKLIENDNLKNIREQIIVNLFNLYRIDSKKIIEFLMNYRISSELNTSEIELWDKDILISQIRKNFIKRKYLESKVVKHLCNKWKQHSIDYDRSLEEEFYHEYFEIEELFYSDYSNYWKEYRNISEIDELIKDKIQEFINDFKINDFKKLINVLNDISKSDLEHQEYILNRNLSNLLLMIEDKIFFDFTKIINTTDLVIQFSENIIVEKLLEILGKEKTEKYISTLSNDDQIRYGFSFYRLLKQDEISKSDSNNLINLYEQNNDYRMTPYNIDFLLAYLEFDNDIVIKISKILLIKSEEDNRFLSGLSLLINSNTEVNKKLITLFKNNVELLETLYLKLDSYDKHFDYYSKTLTKILDIDKSFFSKYLEQKNEGKSFNKEYEILWEREDFQNIIDEVVEFFYSNKTKSCRDTKVKIFFNIDKYSDKECKLANKQINYLEDFVKDNIENINKLKFIFEEIISYLNDFQRKGFIKLIINLNIAFESFEKLSFEKNSMPLRGSTVPMYQKKLEFFQSLLELFEGIEFLKHKKHIEQIIEWKKEQIEIEKKNDFMDNF